MASESFGSSELDAQVDAQSYLAPACKKVRRPRFFPGRRPAGLDRLTAEEKQGWTQDKFRFPPYQYSRRLLDHPTDGEATAWE